MYRGYTMHKLAYMPGAIPQFSVWDPIVQNRIRTTMAYFGGDLSITGIMVGLLRNLPLAYKAPIIQLIATLGLLVGTMISNYDT